MGIFNRKKQIKVGNGRLTKKEIKLLEEASKRTPPKNPKNILITFTCEGCKRIYYYKVMKCIECGESRLKKSEFEE